MLTREASSFARDVDGAQASGLKTGVVNLPVVRTCSSPAGRNQENGGGGRISTSRQFSTATDRISSTPLQGAVEPTEAFLRAMVSAFHDETQRDCYETRTTRAGRRRSRLAY